MTLDKAITEWNGKRRKMGCVSASKWLCKRVPNFYPIRLKIYNWDHVVATDGKIIIDLTPHLNKPRG